MQLQSLSQLRLALPTAEVRELAEAEQERKEELIELQAEKAAEEKRILQESAKRKAEIEKRLADSILKTVERAGKKPKRHWPI